MDTMTDRPDLDRLMFREVTPEGWADFERLFEGRGCPRRHVMQLEVGR